MGMQSKCFLRLSVLLFWNAECSPKQWENYSGRSPWQQICEHGCHVTPLLGNTAVVLDMVLKSAPKCVPCPQGYTDYFQLINGQKRSCYRVLQEPQYWGRASNSCKKTGGNLVSIESKEEMEQIRSIVHKAKEISNIHSLWTGGRKVGHSRWEWAGTGQALTYANWALGRMEHLPDFIEKDYIGLGRPDLKWYLAWDSTLSIGICEKQSSCKP